MNPFFFIQVGEECNVFSSKMRTLCVSINNKRIIGNNKYSVETTSPQSSMSKKHKSKSKFKSKH